MCVYIYDITIVCLLLKVWVYRDLYRIFCRGEGGSIGQ